MPGTSNLPRTGGLYATRPPAGSLPVPALSLAGVPPFSGFLAKFALVEAGLAIDQGAIIAVALGVSLLTLYSMLKIWNEAFWKPVPAAAEGPAPAAAEGPMPAAFDGPMPAAPDLRRPIGLLLLAPIVALIACSVALTVAAGPAFELVDRAAQQLLDPDGYIEAVLGGGGR